MDSQNCGCLSPTFVFTEDDNFVSQGRFICASDHLLLATECGSAQGFRVLTYRRIEVVRRHYGHSMHIVNFHFLCLRHTYAVLLVQGNVWCLGTRIKHCDREIVILSSFPRVAAPRGSSYDEPGYQARHCHRQTVTLLSLRSPVRVGATKPGASESTRNQLGRLNMQIILRMRMHIAARSTLLISPSCTKLFANEP
jgi:hypothetical protein